MNVTLYQAVSTTNLLESFGQRGLGMKTAFKLNKLMNETAGHYQFYKTKVAELQDQYCEKNADGTFIIEDSQPKVKPEFIEVFMRSLQELNVVEVEYSDSLKFDIEEFGDITITMADMQVIAPFISE